MGMSKRYDQTYYETLYAAVMACVEEYKGIIQLYSDNYEDFGFQAMSYETSQSQTIPGVKMVYPHKSRVCGLKVCIYRMPSGRYEVTGYVTA